jgi:hypothetical protein
MRRRLRRLELSQPDKDTSVRLFFVSGGYENDHARAFLRDQGVDLRANDLVVQAVPTQDGRRVYEPMQLVPIPGALLQDAG